VERKPQFKGDGIRHATINGHRFHLRMKDPTKDNFLWIDGQPPLVLDKTAADFVAHLIDAMWLFQQGEGDESQQVVDYVVGKMYEKYGRQTTREKIKADLDRIFGTLTSIAQGSCPFEIGLDSKEITYGDWMSPARMDLAVTYQCNLKCGKCYLGKKEIGPELTTEEWLKVFGILWDIGIPQVVFTGGEPTLRSDIVKLVSEAEEFVTGLVTNGTKLVELAQPLKDASLDYVQVTIESLNPATHDASTGTPGSHAQTVAGICKALDVGLQVVTNTTLTKANVAEFLETIKWLRNMGVKNIACNTLICSGRGVDYKKTNGLSDEELNLVLVKACALAKEIGVNFQWYSPTCYKQGINPIQLGFGVKSCSAAAHNMTIQPDGSVLPCQSWPDEVGNILDDDWDSIWEDPICQDLRDHSYIPDECEECDCEFVETCHGGCPLDESPRACDDSDEYDE